MRLIIFIAIGMLLFWFQISLAKKNKNPTADLVISQLEKLCDK
jgi:hypothetical protein